MAYAWPSNAQELHNAADCFVLGWNVSPEGFR